MPAPRHHRDRVDRADLGADLAALAVVEVEAVERRAVEHDRRVGAVEPAEQAVDAARELDLRLQRRCASRRCPAAARRRRRRRPPCGRSLPGLSSAMRIPPRPRRAQRPASTFGRAARRQRPADRSSGGSPSAAATAPSMTTFTKPEPRSAASRVAGTQRTSTPSSSAGARSALTSTKPSSAQAFGDVGLVRRATARARRRGPGRSIESWRRIGRSAMRV